VTGTQGGANTSHDDAAAASLCWLCDGRIKEHEGVRVASLGGVAVHRRCLPDLAPDSTPEN
jgi:hypothetical protein